MIQSWWAIFIRRFFLVILVDVLLTISFWTIPGVFFWVRLWASNSAPRHSAIFLNFNYRYIWFTSWFLSTRNATAVSAYPVRACSSGTSAGMSYKDHQLAGTPGKINVLVSDQNLKICIFYLLTLVHGWLPPPTEPGTIQPCQGCSIQHCGIPQPRV